MVTKSIIETPFGSKFIYRIDGECVWSDAAVCIWRGIHLPACDAASAAIIAAGRGPCAPDGYALAQGKLGGETVLNSVCGGTLRMKGPHDAPTETPCDP